MFRIFKKAIKKGPVQNQKRLEDEKFALTQHAGEVVKRLESTLTH